MKSPNYIIFTSRNKKWHALFILCLLLKWTGALAQPGKDGAFTVSTTSQILNKYCPLALNIIQGSSTLAITSPTLMPVCAGDLIMVYQAQGASISNTNTSSYGNINSYGSAGLYEFKYVQSVNGNVITTQTTFTNNYNLGGNPQVIKVPQFTNLTINAGASIVPKPWKDTIIATANYRFGGLVVIHASNVTNNGTISATGAGFRGGQDSNNASISLGSVLYTSPLLSAGGEKGESIAGYKGDYDLIGGRYCRGSPANGGGGGTSVNSSGGGGANGFNGNTWTGQGVMIVDVNNPLGAWALDPGYIANSNALTNSSGGGRGGYSWANQNRNAVLEGPGNFNWGGDTRREVGGLGGHPLNNIDAETRIYFGGGGGTGDGNNDGVTDGANGGGIIYLIATTISGSGTITADGNSVGNSVGCNCDGVGGGGAGGTIIIKNTSISAAQIISSKGGIGGNQLVISISPNESEGAGGGGGGGFAAIANGPITPAVNGGQNGTSLNISITEMTSNGATAGASGQTGTVSTTFPTFTIIPTLTVNNNGPLCSGLTLSLLTTFTSTSYNWIGPNNFTATVQNPTLASASPLMNGNYTLTLVSQGCISYASTSVTIYPPPTLSAGVNNSVICSGQMATYTVSGASSYSWMPGAVAGSLVNLFPVATTIYTVTATDLNACTASLTLTQSVNPTPTLSVNASNSVICSGNSATLTASGASSYTWLPLNANTASISVSNLSTSTYTLFANSVNGCTATLPGTVFVNPTPTLIISQSSASICLGSSATLSVSGANTYTWQPPNQNGNSITVSPLVATSYSVTGASVFGCTANASSSISVKPVPVVSFTTFAITCASLGSATVNTSGGLGPFSYTWSPTLQTNSTATNLFPGTYTVDVHDLGTGCIISPTTNFVPLIPLTGSVIATNSVLCYGAHTGTALINLSGGSGSLNYLWTDALSTQTTASAVQLAAGVNTIFVSDALTFCSVTHTFLIDQPSQPTLTIISSSPSVCLGGSITYTAVHSGGTAPYTNSWTNSANSFTTQMNETLAGSYTYTAYGQDAHNCPVSNSIIGLFVINPTVSVSNSSICLFSIGSLTASGATSYTWNTGFVGNPLNVSPATSTPYTVTGSAAGCTASATGSISLKPSPTASFTTNSPLCEGDSLIFEGLGNYPGWSWTGPAGYSHFLQNDTIYPAAPNLTGNYTLKVTAANSCTASLTKSITINATPLLSVSATTVCQGKTLNLYASYLSGASYSWIGPSNTSTVQNPVFVMTTPSQSGHYSITITSAQGCSNSAVANASVIPTPTSVISGSNQYCQGSSMQLNGSGGDYYAWFGPNNFSSSQPSISFQQISTQSAGSYTLYAYTGACYGSSALNITVHPLPTPTASTSGPVCENKSVYLFGSTASTYTWTGPNGFTSNQKDPVIFLASQAVSGVYTLSVSDANNCKANSVVAVSVAPAPVPIVQNATVCLGGSITLSVSGGTSYLWTGPLNFSSNFSTAVLPLVTINNAGSYTVLVSGSNSCSTLAYMQLSALPFALPTPSISAPDKACLNTNIILIGSGGVSYLWQGPENFTSTQKDFSLSITSSSLAGVYTLSVKNESNCVSSATTAITVYPLPQGSLMLNKNNSCVPFSSDFKLSSNTKLSSFKEVKYSIDSKFFNDTLFSYNFNSPGSKVISVIFTDTNNCVNTSTAIVTAYPKPIAEFEFTPVNPVAGIDEVIFYNTSKGDGLGYWTWFLQGHDSITSNHTNPSHMYANSGSYPVVLIAKNKWGCLDTLIKVVVINDEFTLFVPNAFTPNGDKLNDIFYAKGHGVSKFKLEIYDRWGENIFQSNELENGWDGTYKGKECKTDSYIWKIIASDVKGNTKTLTGHIALLRGEVIQE